MYSYLWSTASCFLEPTLSKLKSFYLFLYLIFFSILFIWLVSASKCTANICTILVKGLSLCLWELWHSVINTTHTTVCSEWCVLLITKCHNSHKHSQSLLTSTIRTYVRSCIYNGQRVVICMYCCLLYLYMSMLPPSITYKHIWYHTE